VATNLVRSTQHGRFDHVGKSRVTGLNVYSLLVAVLGAVACLLLYQAIRQSGLSLP
jgi:uncharacterized membrane protein YeaQ/YmgE (transglycosylase-associated protein family)